MDTGKFDLFTVEELEYLSQNGIESRYYWKSFTDSLRFNHIYTYNLITRKDTNGSLTAVETSLNIGLAKLADNKEYRDAFLKSFSNEWNFDVFTLEHLFQTIPDKQEESNT